MPALDLALATEDSKGASSPGVLAEWNVRRSGDGPDVFAHATPAPFQPGIADGPSHRRSITATLT
jgi:hypothetical protein